MRKIFPTLPTALPDQKYLLPFILLAVGIILIPIPAFAGPSGVRYFRIEASRFAYSPAILSVNPGDRVVIDLVAMDVVHGLALDGYDLEITADPGQTARLDFVADRSGSYRFRCSTICGNMHPFMIGKLQVGNNPVFWRGIALTLLLAAMFTFRGKR